MFSIFEKKMNLGPSPIKTFMASSRNVENWLVKKLSRLGIYIGKYIYEIFSKFYGKVGVIFWWLYHLIWKNYILNWDLNSNIKL